MSLEEQISQSPLEAEFGDEFKARDFTNTLRILLGYMTEQQAVKITVTYPGEGLNIVHDEIERGE